MESEQHLHIVICPWLAFGHMLPALELAGRLASRGHLVSYVSTPRNIARLRHPHPLVKMVPLQLPRVDGLPEGAECTTDIPRDLDELLKIASDGLATPFSDFLGACSKQPDWVVADYLCYWAAAAAGKCKIPCALFSICAATVHDPRRSSEWTEQMNTEGASGLSLLKRAAMTFQACQLLAFRSCVEMEPESIAAIDAKAGAMPYVPLGLLPPAPPPPPKSVDKDDDNGVSRWLDAQPPKSVVYVALGSEAPLRADQVREMALGLELAGKRFLWALRKPAVGDDILPPGFEERTRGYGLVSTGWVAQLSVLAHGSVAAFLTHSGWSSAIEGLLFGHPLIMLPIAVDQWLNAELMEAKGVGVQVARHGDDGSSFHREAVAAAVTAVTTDQDGIFKANAKKLQQMVADRECHEKYIDGFVSRLKSTII